MERMLQCRKLERTESSASGASGILTEIAAGDQQAGQRSSLAPRSRFQEASLDGSLAASPRRKRVQKHRCAAWARMPDRMRLRASREAIRPRRDRYGDQARTDHAV